MILPLLPGEQALEQAPQATLANGAVCIPQHYLTYQHTLSSVESVVLEIEYDEKYPVFVSEDAGGIYIQVGVIGKDNYPQTKSEPQPFDAQFSEQSKIVYGRKWRVEPQLPTAEIVQTVFLALKKAKEHEIRELFRLSLGNKVTTPFNNHHDLVMLAQQHSSNYSHVAAAANKYEGKPFEQSEQGTAAFLHQLKRLLQDVNYGGCTFDVETLHQVAYQYLVVLAVKISEDVRAVVETNLPELISEKPISLLLDACSPNSFLYALIAELIKLSDRHIDENFLFQGYARFSWQNDVMDIADVSAKTRSLHHEQHKQDFKETWSQNNYETDKTRVPTLSRGQLSQKLLQQLDKYTPLSGLMPEIIK